MEDLMADQSAVLHKLVWALEPEVQLVENDSRLGVRIQPDRSIWADQRRDWLHQIAELVRELEGR